MLKSFCCLFLTSFFCQACGRRWEVMIKKLDSSGNHLLVDFLVLFLFHSLFHRLSLSPRVDISLLSWRFTPFLCTASTKCGVSVCVHLRMSVHAHEASLHWFSSVVIWSPAFYCAPAVVVSLCSAETSAPRGQEL